MYFSQESFIETYKKKDNSEENTIIIDSITIHSILLYFCITFILETIL